MKTSCQDAIELLPWLINGSLEESERQALVDHLAACDSCRRELEQTVEAWQLFSEHVPSLALAEYAHGLPSSELSRERIERHLAFCPECRQEFDLAMSDRVVDFKAARRVRAGRPSRRRVTDSGRRPAPWRRIAIAASLFAVLGSGGLVLSLYELRSVSTTRQLTESPPQEVPSVMPAPRSLPGGGAERHGDAGKLAIFNDDFESGGIAAWSASDSRTPSRKPESNDAS